MQPLVHFAGRILLALAFLGSAAGTLTHFSEIARQLAGQGWPAASGALGILVALELAGSMAVLVGFRAQLGALLLAASAILHLWMFRGLEGVVPQVADAWSWPVGLAILGGTLTLYCLGPGPWAFDELHKKTTDYGDSNVLG